MNWQVLLGIGIIAAGSWVTFLGTQRDQRKDTAAVSAKVDEVLARLNVAEALPEGSIERQETLTGIKDDFIDWAVKFEAGRDKKRLLIERDTLSEQVRDSDFADAHRLVLGTAIDFIRNSLDAYSKHADRPFDVQLPTLPRDLINEVWGGSIEFSPHLIWRLNTFSTDRHVTNLSIKVDRGEGPGSRNDLFLLGSRIDPSETVDPVWFSHVTGSYFLPSEALKVDFTRFAGNEDALKALMRTLIEIQILRLEDTSN